MCSECVSCWSKSDAHQTLLDTESNSSSDRFINLVSFLHMQDSSKPMFKADSGFVPLLLTFVANRSNQEVAMVWGAQKIYEDRERPKG